MSRFIFDITDEQRVKLEAVRQARGLRSLADAARALIDDAGATSAPRAPITAPQVTKTEKPKSQPVKSRLKGEWKAP